MYKIAKLQEVNSVEVHLFFVTVICVFVNSMSIFSDQRNSLKALEIFEL